MRAAVLGAALTASFAVGCQAGGEQPTAKPSPASPAKLGATVRDGQFEFKVTKVSTGRRVSNKLSGEAFTAKGQYVTVRVTVTNRADEPRYFVADEQGLQAGGKTYSPDTDATVTVDKGPEIGLPEEVNPDASERVVIVFDMPKGAKLTAVELHDTAETHGVRVATQ